MIIKYLALEGEKCPRFNSRNLEKFCEKILEIVNDSSKFSEIVLNATQILTNSIADLASPEEAKTLAAVEKIQSAFRLDSK